jgi:hypothetical protein
MALPILPLCQTNQNIQLACADSWSKRNRGIRTSALWTAALKQRLLADRHTASAWDAWDASGGRYLLSLRSGPTWE